MTQVAYPANGLRRDGTLFPFDARGKRNGKATASADTRRLQQMQKELRQLSVSELRGIRNDWAKPPLNAMQWVRELLPYLDGLIKERTPKGVTPIKKLLITDLRHEVLALRIELNALTARFEAESPTGCAKAVKPLPSPRQHAKGKKRRLSGPMGHLAAITRPWLDRAANQPGETFQIGVGYTRNHGVSIHRFQSSLSASASYFYGPHSMTTRITHDSNGVVNGVEFTFVGNPKPIRTPRRTNTHPVSIDQSTPT